MKLHMVVDILGGAASQTTLSNSLIRVWVGFICERLPRGYRELEFPFLGEELVLLEKGSV